ncbi:hypothetical protein V0R51_25800 [Pseudomonas otitidis]|uniref:hypothetical protein n=1 Tax=Metapseudomonas otitidis TaxID=319939 RepID=UPI002E7BB56F|nr:hypothetical protein [Pseudomonas otitidis]MEE1896326.1 hypothetical protein [Pseudomonas otitidis]
MTPALRVAAFMLITTSSLTARAEAPLHGYYQAVTPATGHNQTLTVLATARGLSFFYMSESGAARCEVPGIASPEPGSDDTYLFTDDPDHHLYANWEGYGAPDASPRCQVSLVFAEDKVVVKPLDAQRCQSFCGLRGAIGGTLERVGPWAINKE